MNDTPSRWQATAKISRYEVSNHLTGISAERLLGARINLDPSLLLLKVGTLGSHGSPHDRGDQGSRIRDQGCLKLREAFRITMMELKTFSRLQT